MGNLLGSFPLLRKCQLVNGAIETPTVSHDRVNMSTVYARRSFSIRREKCTRTMLNSQWYLATGTMKNIPFS